MMNTTQAPFSTPGTLPYQAPPFEHITEHDFLPALQAGIAAKRQEIARIASNPDAPDFANTYEALERSGELLNRVNLVFGAMTSANTSDYLQQVDEEITPQLTALEDDIKLNGTLFSRLDAVYQQRHILSLDAESLRLVEVVWQQFQLAGASLSETSKIRLKALNQEAATLSTRFTNTLLAAARTGALIVNDSAALAGLSDADLSVAQDAANARGLEKAWLLVLQNTTQQPALQALQSRATREALYNASVSRAEKGDSNDTRQLVLRLAQVRAEQAQLLGFNSYAEWKLQDQMAKTPDAAFRFMRNIVPAATARAQNEAAAIQQMIDDRQAGLTLAPWDWSFYAEQVRQARYDLDETAIRPYFELNSVLEKGVFWTATQLYGIQFTERYDLPVYHPDVRVYEIFDADDTPVALFYIR